MIDCIPLGVTLTNFSLEEGSNEQQWKGSSNITSQLSDIYKEPSFISKGNASQSVSSSNTETAIFPNNSLKDLLYFEQVLYSRVIVLIGVFGVIGNLLNLIVLTQKRLQKQMDRMEKSAHYGLMALALSDLLFCISVIPYAWVDKNQFHYHSLSFDMFYAMYGESVINAFIMSSTWLTVAMATSRYMAICHPLHARDVIGMTFAKVSIIVVFVLCILFNLPRFWNEVVDYMDCQGGGRVYFPAPGPLAQSPSAEMVYFWLYFIFGILLPLVALAFCNANLIRALRKSTNMRRQYQRDHKNQRDTTHHITVTLIIIVIMYFLLVVPAEITNFSKQAFKHQRLTNQSFNVALAVVNTLQAINFSFNFILYCVVNVHFRRTLKELFCCCCAKKGGSSTGAGYESVIMSQTGFTRNTAVSEF